MQQWRLEDSSLSLQHGEDTNTRSLKEGEPSPSSRPLKRAVGSVAGVVERTSGEATKGFLVEADCNECDGGRRCEAEYV